MSIYLLDDIRPVNPNKARPHVIDVQCQWGYPKSNVLDAMEKTINRDGLLSMTEFNSLSYEEKMFFGGAISDSIRPSKVEAIAHTLSKPRSSRKAFEQAKKEGKMILNRYSKSTLKVTSSATGKDPTGRAFSHNLWGEYLRNPPSLLLCGVRAYELPIEDSFKYENTGNNLQALRGYYGFGGTYTEYERLHDDLSEEETRFIGLQKHKEIEGMFAIDRDLVTEALSEMNALGFELTANLAELPETIGFIYNGIKTILTMHKSVLLEIKKLKKRHAHENIEELADKIASLWMGYRYGVMPIVYSVEDLLEVLSSQMATFQTHRSGKQKSVTVDGSPVDIINRVFLKRRYLVASPSMLDNMSKGLPTAAWEVTRLSFVLDWAIGIGDFLAAIGEPSLEFDQVSSYSFRIKDTHTWKHGTSHDFSMEIDSYLMNPITATEWIGIPLKNPFGPWKRHLDMLSLSWFAFKKILASR